MEKNIFSTDNTEDKPWMFEDAVEEKETVNHPSHYNQNGLETIDVIKAFCPDLNGVEGFYIGNCLKYLTRWKHKNGIEDLKKAQWYLEHIIEYEEGKEA